MIYNTLKVLPILFKNKIIVGFEMKNLLEIEKYVCGYDMNKLYCYSCKTIYYKGRINRYIIGNWLIHSGIYYDIKNDFGNSEIKVFRYSIEYIIPIVAY